MALQEEYRKQIFKLIKEAFKKQKRQKGFCQGETLIPYGGRIYDQDEVIKLVDASLDFWLTGGRFTQEFEKKLAKYIGCRYCLLVNSGSSANVLAVSALMSPLLHERQLKKEDEVIVAACNFPTTVNPIVQNGLTPVFVDVDLGNYNISTRQIEKALTARTRAIVVAHTLGNPADMDKIIRIAQKHELWIIEDNCDSLGSRYKDKLSGSFGHISTCSFYPAHHITMGEGGAVCTQDSTLKRILVSLRDWGRDCWCEPGHDNTCKNRFSQKHGDLPFGYDHKYVYSHLGYNFKATDMQAAVGVAQMDKLDAFIAARRDNFDYLYKNLRRFHKYLLLPEATKGSQPAWFGFPMLVKNNQCFSRMDLVSYLEKHKIATRMIFAGNITKQPAYQDVHFRVSGSLKNTDNVMNNLFWIGVYPGIKQEQREYITKVFSSFFKDLK